MEEFGPSLTSMVMSLLMVPPLLGLVRSQVASQRVRTDADLCFIVCCFGGWGSCWLAGARAAFVRFGGGWSSHVVFPPMVVLLAIGLWSLVACPFPSSASASPMNLEGT